MRSIYQSGAGVPKFTPMRRERTGAHESRQDLGVVAIASEAVVKLLSEIKIAATN
jgi:hypothetical protein